MAEWPPLEDENSVPERVELKDIMNFKAGDSDSSLSLSPEQVLVKEVIIRAVQDIVGLGDTSTQEEKNGYAAADAWDWIFSDDIRDDFNIHYCCEAIGINLDVFRAYICDIVAGRREAAPRIKSRRKV